ncbi:MAG: glycosyltransferase family 4 protein [Rhizobiales bacterium]|nr:glycosyltransferase family 4 protein [Hyphomicrobiales bacterium]
MVDAGDALVDGANRPRIVHCFRSPVGGIFRHVRDLVEMQVADGALVGIVCDSSTGGAHEEALFRAIEPQLALGLHRVPMRRQISPADLTAFLRLYRQMKALRPDIIHTHGAKGGAYGRVIGALLRLTGSPAARLYCPHGGSLHYDVASRSGKVFFLLERALERFTDAFVFVSAFEAEAFRAKVGTPRRPFVIASNGIRDAEFVPVETEADAADFLYIGMMRDLKGPDLFLAALAKIRDETGVAPRALMIGDGPDTERYQRQAAEFGLAATTRFHAAMPARKAFAMARIVVVPSRAESMPYIVLEAIGANRPLVATDVGGIPEIFAEQRTRLVPPGSAEALATEMRRLLDDPATAEAEAAALRESIRPRFSVEAMARNVSEAYGLARGRTVLPSPETS